MPHRSISIQPKAIVRHNPDKQIYFVNQIVEYIVQNGLMKDLSVLRDAPFTDNGTIVEVFADMSLWFGIKSVIDRINANAIAA